MNDLNSLYKIRFWFDFGGVCLWSQNEVTKEKFGYAVDLNSLGISKQLIEKIDKLQNEFSNYIDWSDPTSPTKWTISRKNDFLIRTTEVIDELQVELGDMFEVQNDVEKNLV